MTDQNLRLPVLRTRDGIVKTLDQWVSFTRRDDCLNRMVPRDLRAILSNLSNTRTPPKVKDLVWRESPNKEHEGNRLLCETIENIIDQYFIFFDDGSYRLHNHECDLGLCETLELAKAAAQAHYNSLILSALEI
mgnify:FL=1